MTEKPSVCKHCDLAIENVYGMWMYQNTPRCLKNPSGLEHEPVAEPAELPCKRCGAIEDHPNHMLNGHHFEPAEPSASPEHKHEGFPQHVTRQGKGVWNKNCPQCSDTLNSPAPQPVAQSEADYYAAMEQLNAQPVAGEGPGIKVTIYDPIAYLQELSADMGRRGECDICLKLEFCISVLKEKQAEGTTKLEEIARIIHAKMEPIVHEIEELLVGDCRSAAQAVIDGLRPFITPACHEFKADNLFGVYCGGSPESIPGIRHWMKDLGLFWEGWERVADYVNSKLAGAPPLEHMFAGRFNENWTREHENYLLDKIAARRHEGNCKICKVATPASTGEAK